MALLKLTGYQMFVRSVVPKESGSVVTGTNIRSVTAIGMIGLAGMRLGIFY